MRLQRCADGRLGLEQLDRQGDKIAKVDAMRVALELFVGGIDAGHLAGAFGGLARLGVRRLGKHGVGEPSVGFGVDRLVLRPRDGGQHVGDDLSRIIEIAVMREPQPRELLLEEFDGLSPIHHPRVFRQPELGMETTDDIETEGVERTDPHRGRSLGPLARNALRHLARGLVREGQQQDAPRIDTLLQQAFYTRDQRLRLASAGARLEQIGFATMRRGRGLQEIERSLHMRLGRGGRHDWEEQGVEQLLGDNFERRAELRGDRRGGYPLVDMQRSRDVAGKQKLAREQVHLDLAALPASIIDDPIHADRRRLGRARRIDRRRRLAVGVVAEFDMPNLMRHEERLLEARPRILMKDQIVGGDEGRAAAVEHGRAHGRRFDVDPAPLGLGDCKVIGRPGIGARGDETSMKLGGDLPGELHAVHLSRSPPTAGRACRSGRRRRSALAQR